MTTDLVPINGRHLARGFDDEVVGRALALMLTTGNVAEAYRALKEELEAGGAKVIPAYDTLLMWARQQEDVITAIHADKKRDMVARSEDAVSAWAGRMVEAATARDESGKYTVPDSQVYLNYGTAQDKRTNWENAGSKAPAMAVQFNFVKRTQD